MTQSLALELARQAMRLIGLALVNVPWMPDTIVGLTSHEDVIAWVAGLILYACADTGWLVSKWRQWRAK